MWQDWVLSIGGLVLATSLLPSVWSSNKPSVWTSAVSAAVVGLFSYTFMSLGLTLGAGGATLTAGLWLVLVIQVIRRKE